MVFKKRVGTAAEVWHGTAEMTSGRVKKSGLFKDKYGNIKSLAKSKAAKKSNNLKKAGWGAEKGKFGAVRLSKTKKRSSKKRSKGRSKSKRSRY